MTSTSDPLLCWTAPNAAKKVDCLCLGTGRFLRSVLVPALIDAGLSPGLIQTRGSSFLKYMNEQEEESASYPIDTVLPSGDISTTRVSCFGAFSVGTEAQREATWEFCTSLEKTVKIIGVGVTEAGLASPDTQAMKNLLELIQKCKENQQKRTAESKDDGKLCIIDMDNVPNNGDRIRSHLITLSADNPDMLAFIENRVVFINTMVDRITSAREGSHGMVPRCEPLPAKALVLLDPHQDLPFEANPKLGVVIRKTRDQLNADIALKLRVANGTHTALAHTLALQKHVLTSYLTTTTDGDSNLVLDYLDSIVKDQIMAAAVPLFGIKETEACWEDWRNRLIHPKFGLSTFFITQNGAAKGGIRWGPTLVNIIATMQQPITVAMAYAYAALLRWLTPIHGHSTNINDKTAVFRGWLDGADPKLLIKSSSDDEDEETISYADGLRHNLQAGWYEFRAQCSVEGKSISSHLMEIPLGSQPSMYYSTVKTYLVASDGGDLASVASSPSFEILAKSVSTLLARMTVGDGMETLLQEMRSKSGVYTEGFSTNASVLIDGSGDLGRELIHYRPSPIPATSKLLSKNLSASSVESVLKSEVASVEAIDLHTHLLPPTHGSLCLWGIDELLTYHYLVAEYFITAPAIIKPEDFYAMDKREQADLIWQALFIDRSPVSEACRGVLTTLCALGLQEEVQNRDLEGVRRFYHDNYRQKGLDGIQSFSDRIFQQAGLKYAIMTNIPFDPNEVRHWRPAQTSYSHNYRSALRVDPLLAGDSKTIEAALRASGYNVTLEGARQFLRDWCDTMQPEYMMASTPHDFVLKEGTLAGVMQTGTNKEAMQIPGAFADAADCPVASCTADEDATASVIQEDSDFLSEVLMQVCQERDLPLALKIGAHRGVNPSLQTAGDGVVAFADAQVLARLCTRFPKVRFLATFLSRNNQHEACVLASKFRNLHIYGCWWYCNNPSMISEITTMRVEMLGTAFTAQHSDARVLDQLVYKWAHSRTVIANVLANEYKKLLESGWQASRRDIRRDVKRLFGGSYEEFMAKSFS